MKKEVKQAVERCGLVNLTTTDVMDDLTYGIEITFGLTKNEARFLLRNALMSNVVQNEIMDQISWYLEGEE